MTRETRLDRRPATGPPGGTSPGARLLPGLLLAIPLALGLAAAAPASGGGVADPEPPSECSRELALRIQSYYDSVRDLRAHFEQETRRAALGSMGGGVMRAGGEVLFAKPGRMRWSYETPEPSLVVSDGSTVWVYDPAAAEAQKLALGPGFLSGAAIQFLLGEGDLLADFSVEAADCSARPVRLSLTPRADAAYERLEVVADPDTGEVSETVVVDLLGNRTHIALSQIRINTDPDPEAFRFEPPEGVRVLEAPAP